MDDITIMQNQNGASHQPDQAAKSNNATALNALRAVRTTSPAKARRRSVYGLMHDCFIDAILGVHQGGIQSGLVVTSVGVRNKRRRSRGDR
jgi:hypothetical protein